MTSSAKSFYSKYRPLLALGSAALLAELAYAILNLSALPMYMKFVVHAEEFWGLIFSTFLLTETASRPALGALGDRIGRKPLMLAGPAITAVTAYLTILLHGSFLIPGLILLRAIDGLGSGALWMNAFAAIGDLSEEGNRSTGMSLLNMTYMGGMALGFLMGGAVNEYFHSYLASFYLVSLLLALSVLVMLIFLPSKLGRQHAEMVHGEPLELPMETPTSFKLSNLVRSFREMPDMIVMAGITFLGMGMLTPIVKLYAVEHLGLTEKQFGVLVAPIAAAMGIFAVPMGRIGDKYGKCSAVCWGLFASAIAMWALALFRSITVAGIAGIAIGIGFITAFPAWNALIVSLTTPDRRGEVLGSVGLAQGAAAIVGASLGSFIYASDVLSFPRLGVVNYNVPFWFSAILLSAGAVMAFTWMRSRHCHRDPGGGVSVGKMRAVVGLAILGFLALVGWIGYRYTQPVPPDRVAWQWVQQLFRGRPDKAVRFAITDGGCDGAALSRGLARKYSNWRKRHEARYTVRFAEVTDTGADVPVTFILKGGVKHEEHVLLRRLPSREWRVCGVREEPAQED
jgi:DHA1 family multidrug resistance protein-like MFS transporter